MTFLDLFSGIGAFALGLSRAGMTPVGFCEIDPFCRDVLRRHWPDVPILHDVRTAEFPNADVICGGFPCTDVSRAGKRAGITGPDSGLYRELVRAIRVVRPKVAILENVAALLGDGMGDVLGDLAEGGDCRWIEYDCVPAVAVGAPHERDRVWIVAHTAEERSQGTQLQRRNSGIDTRSGNEVSNRATSNASHPECLQSRERYIAQSERGWQNKTEQTRLGVGGNAQPTNPESDRCGQGRTGRPPDSFARIRDEARRNSADPYGARLAFREGIGRDAWEGLTTAQRSRGEDVEQSIWSDESPISRVDATTSDRLDEKELGRVNGQVAGPDPALPALRRPDDQKAIQRASGGHGPLFTSQNLRRDVHGTGHDEGIANEIGNGETRSGFPKTVMRDVRDNATPLNPSQEPGLVGQFDHQPSNALRVMSHNVAPSTGGYLAKTSAPPVSLVRQRIIPEEPVPNAPESVQKAWGIWPDVPALLEVGQDCPDWMDRTKATGNTLDPFIPELIALAILDQQQ